MNLKKMTGKLFVTGNSLLGEDKPDQPDTYGFNVIKYPYFQFGARFGQRDPVEQPSAGRNRPVADRAGRRVGRRVQLYDQIQTPRPPAFSPSGKEVKDLAVTVHQVTDDGMALLASEVRRRTRGP